MSNSNRVVALTTSDKGRTLIIGGNPTTESVEGFIIAHHKMADQNVPCGVDQLGRKLRATRILEGRSYPSIEDAYDPVKKGRKLNLKNTLPESEWPDWAKGTS